ncbi:MAG: peptidylprolyl isomerase [Deltaproteobacteria bacterium]|nr:peptidylprolyl isomerase [Deltaproteobacteria bacterium]
MKKFISLWFLAVILAASSLQAESVDRIVAVVNEDIIILSELNTAFEPYRKRIEDTYKGAERDTALAESRKAFLNRLIDASLIEQEARKNGISVKDEEVTAAIKDMADRRNVALDDLAKELAKEGLSLSAYKKDVREQMVRMRLLRREIKSRLMVTDQEIGEYYRVHRSDYEGREAVRIQQILLTLPKDAGGEAREKMRKAAEEISGRLKNGEPFEILAASIASGPAAGGGDLGFIERGMVLPEVEKAAFALDKGAVSGIIESPAGFHIIRALDKRGGGLKPIEEVREEIQGRIEEQKMMKKFDEWLAALRKKSLIEIKL